MSSMLEFRNVRFLYGGREILHDASFVLERGTASALVGPNGVGKTTLLRLASGVLRPFSGEILLDGIPLAALSIRAAARIVAVIPQHLEIPFDFTVEQVVEQGRTPHLPLLGSPGRADRMAVDRALERSGAADLRHRLFNELSGGERQRVKIALGLAQEPRLLLLDEPTQNLDIGRQAELLATLRALRADGLTVLASIHELHLVPANFSSVLLLEPGATLLRGSPAEILQLERLRSAFGAVPEYAAFALHLPVSKDFA